MMQESSGNYRAQLVKILTFLGGLYFVLEFVLPERVLEAVGVSSYHENISYGFIVVGAMAFGLGLLNLFMIHGSKIIFRKKGCLNSFALLAGLFTMMTFACLDWQNSLRISAETRKLTLIGDFAIRIAKDIESKKEGVPAYEFRKAKLIEATRHIVEENRGFYANLSLKENGVEALKRDAENLTLKIDEKLRKLESLSEADLSLLSEFGALLNTSGSMRGKIERAVYAATTTKQLFSFLNQGLFVSLGSAMFSLLGFYIAAAAYRAFRIRSFESSLMMLAAIIVMFGQMSFTLRLYGGFADWRAWLMNVPNSAAFRAIKIGASVAGLVLAFRMWFSIESQSFSEKK